MKTNSREINIYFNPENSADRKTIAYAKSHSQHVKTFDHTKANFTATYWEAILKKLDITPKKLFNKALPEYQEKIQGMDLDNEGWLNVLKKNPHMIKAPIAIKGNKAMLCESPTDVYKL